MAKKSKTAAQTVATVTASAPAPAAPEKAPVVPATSPVEQASSPAPKKGNGKVAAKDAKAPGLCHPLRQLVEAAILAGKATALSSACQAVGISMKGDVEERKARLQAWLDGKPVAAVEPASTPAGKPAKTERAPKDPNRLRKPQVRILQALRTAGKPLSRKEIASQAPCDLAWLNSWIGSENPEVRAKNDAAEGKSLLTHGYVRTLLSNVEGERGAKYEITTEGLAALRTVLGEPEPTPVPTEEQAPKKVKKTKKTK